VPVTPSASRQPSVVVPRAPVDPYPTYRYQSPARKGRGPVSSAAELTDSESADENAPRDLDDESQLMRFKRPQLLQSLPPKAFRALDEVPSRLRSDSAPPAKAALGQVQASSSHIDRYSSTDEDEESSSTRSHPHRQRLNRNVASNSSAVTVRPSRSTTRRPRGALSRESSIQPKKKQGLRERHIPKVADEFAAAWKNSVDDVISLALGEIIDQGYLHWAMRLLPRCRVQMAAITKQRLELAYLGSLATFPPASSQIMCASELLQRLELYLPAADLRKASQLPSTTDTTVFHVSCGRCQKAILDEPFAYCNRCAGWIDTCAVCHRRGSTIFCATCGHGAHSDCLVNDIFGSPVASRPSTPNLTSAWSWLDANSRDEGQCPSGCGHAGCCLGR
jgi:hypothetical protein